MGKEQKLEDDYASQIKAIFADPSIVAAMRQRIPVDGKRADPVFRDKRREETDKSLEYPLE